ncbi:MAG: polyprenyl synthetase family protein [Candidatus Pacearchaeota archaeon]|nr:polyprenyl synthetase family protein [Candidatus Pacearchaeota archaeon]
MNNELKNLLKQNAVKIDLEIEKFLPKNIDKEWLRSFVGNPSFEYDEFSCSEAISKPIWDLLSRGGKRWRPYLMELAYRAVGGENNINEFLILPELIHNGTLMVDDIEDNSDLRRGKACIHKIFGEDITINAGNTLYYLPLTLVKKNKSLSNDMKVKIYEMINDEMLKLGFGQGMDIYWHRSNKEIVTENQYLQMCAYKTGTLARIAIKLGTILGNAREEEINIFGKFAESIGVAFQIQDDILNITNKEWGKDFGEDITEGKRSLMVINVLTRADEEEKKDLLGILKIQTKNKVLIKEAIRIIEKHDSVNYAKEVAQKIIDDAWKELEPNLKENNFKIKLKMFADFLINRDI